MEDITPHLEAVRAYAKNMLEGGAGHQQELGHHLQACVDWIDAHKDLGVASTKGPSHAAIKEGLKSKNGDHKHK